MILYAPSYASSFVCTADQCSHSCCIGWEIDVDPDALKKYESLTDGYKKRILESIERTETPHFRLCEGERCPHLAKSGLCNIILNVGEAYLCEICREHPRFYHTTARGREMGLGMACEEACRIILTAKDFKTVQVIGEIDCCEEPPVWDCTDHRRFLFEILEDEGTPYPERREALFKAYGLPSRPLEDDRVRELLASLEYLDAENKALFSCYRTDVSVDAACHEMLARTLAYFIFRHCSPAEEPTEFCTALCFSLLCERLIASVAEKEGVSDLCGMIRIARTVSEEIEYSVENTEAIKDAIFDEIIDLFLF